MSNTAVLKQLENILGKSTRKAKGNYSFLCPSCHHHKRKLEVNLETGQYRCWVCGSTKQGLKGKTISSLLRRIKVNPSLIKHISNNFEPQKQEYVKSKIELSLPEEFISLIDIDKKNIMAKHALVYLKKRNITTNDIILYNIGYCETGKYKNMIIFPSYDNNLELNYYFARTFNDSYSRFGKPDMELDFIGLEYLINFNLPIIICEGIFDAIAIKRNAIPLYGKDITSKLKKKIISSDVKKLYIALDNDALKQALEYAEEFMNYGKEIYLVELEKKDPSVMGFKEFTELIQKTRKMSVSDLMKLKINLR